MVRIICLYHPTAVLTINTVIKFMYRIKLDFTVLVQKYKRLTHTSQVELNGDKYVRHVDLVLCFTYFPVGLYEFNADKK